MDTIKINPNDCQRGKSRGVTFRTGAHRNDKKDVRHLRRQAKRNLKNF